MFAHTPRTSLNWPLKMRANGFSFSFGLKFDLPMVSYHYRLWSQKIFWYINLLKKINFNNLTVSRTVFNRYYLINSIYQSKLTLVIQDQTNF